MKPKIKYTDYGVAYYIPESNVIELNKNLKKYPKLKAHILKHELEHSKSNGIIDLKIELKEMLNFKEQFEILKFMIKYPSTFTQYSPIFINKKGFSFNYFLVLSYLLMLVGVVMIYA